MVEEVVDYLQQELILQHLVVVLILLLTLPVEVMGFLLGGTRLP
jgi:hypothetical protein